MDINPDDLISKTDILLFGIWEELRELNKTLCSIAKDTGGKKNVSPKTDAKSRTQRVKKQNVAFLLDSIKPNNLGGDK